MNYTITLADGKQLTGLGRNGTNFVSAEYVDEKIFENNLTIMTVSDGTTETVYHNVELIQQQQWIDGTYYLSFREKTSRELMEETVKHNSDDMTDLQLALTKVYELITGSK